MMFLTERNKFRGRKVIVVYVRRRDLGDIMVLTVQTAEVTTRASEGKTGSARMEVVEWLFLNRVDGQRTGLGIDLTDERSTKVTTTTTESCLAIGNATMVRAEMAFHLPILKFSIIPALH
jgi:hypothetical protein